MRSHLTILNLLGCLLLVFAPVSAFAQPAFAGLELAAEWTDYEDQSNEMPSRVWGTCDADQADTVGIVVDFEDGTSGFAVYSGVSSLWNLSFSGIGPESDGGFFENCGTLHFLYNNGSSLPMAWTSCVMPYSNNFDLDYSEQYGSHFRASVEGWESAHIQTYCGDGVAAEPVPTFTLPGLIALLVLLAVMGVMASRSRRRLA